LAASGDASGTLAIGAAPGKEAVAPGRLDAATVVGGSGTGGARLVFNHAGTHIFSRDGTFTTGILITGSTAVEHQGPGLTALLRENDYTGGTTIQQGTLVLRNSGWLTGDVVNDGTLAFQRVFSGNFNGDISGTGSVIQVGANTTITLGGSNSYAGGTTVNSGTLSSAVAGAFPHHTPFTVNGGTLSLQNSILLSMSALQGDG